MKVGIVFLNRLISILLLCATGGFCLRAETTLQEVLKDQKVDAFWHYDNLEAGMAAARKTGKPLLVTIRCVPCKACLGMDSKVVNPSDPELRALMEKFVCVRIVQAWGLDLSLFQYDMNMSWAAFFLNADRVIYGRYGTRAAQRDENAITVPGFKKALAGALEWHGLYQTDRDKVTPVLAKKTGPAPRWKKPEDIPAIPKTVRWNKKLGRMTAQQTTSCVHCHFVPAAEMMGLLSVKEPITDRHLWAYPLPESIGMSLDPKEQARVTRIVRGSPAEGAGLRAGDRIVDMDKQPILSIADVQWVLHRADDSATLEMVVATSSQRTRPLTMRLPEGWRRNGEFVARPSSWDLFKVKLFGVAKMKSLSLEERAALDLTAKRTALRIEKLSPSWGGINHDARKAGLKEGDVILEIDGRADISSHSELLAYLVQKKSSGDKLALVVLHDGQRRTMELTLNWEDRIRALRKP